MVVTVFLDLFFVFVPIPAPPPLEAKVLFTWKGSKANHLSLVRGSVVRVLQQSEKWWSGEYQGKVGWFPKTFVKIIDTPEESEATPTSVADATLSGTHHSSAATPSSPTSQVTDDGAVVLYQAIYDYTGEADGDLTFKEGDTIQASVLVLFSPLVTKQKDCSWVTIFCELNI